MSTCARCGLERGAFDSEHCAVGWEGHASTVTEQMALVHCRDRELANLRSLLRSVTISLENAAGRLEEPYSEGDVAHALQLIDYVLEALS